MDYNRIMQEILNIGEELLKSGQKYFVWRTVCIACAEVMDLCEVMSMLRRSIFK